MGNLVLTGATSGSTTVVPTDAVTATVTLPSASGTLINTGSAGAITQSMLATGVAGTGPTFSAYSSSNQTISASTYIKIVFGTERWDTASCFDTSASRFTPNVAGYYLVTANVELSANSNAWCLLNIYKNGSNYSYGSNYPTSASAGPAVTGATLVYMNGTTDYLEIYAGASAGGTAYGTVNTNFTAFLARAA